VTKLDNPSSSQKRSGYPKTGHNTGSQTDLNKFYNVPSRKMSWLIPIKTQIQWHLSATTSKSHQRFCAAVECACCPRKRS